MIVNYQYKFIFIKTKKVAGTSVEIALSKYCSPHDIITPLAKDDERKREDLGYASSRNFKNKTGKPVYFNHAPAKRVRRLIGRDRYHDFYRFTIERNPWDKAVSAYFWRGGKDDPASFRQFVRMGGVYDVSDYDLYCINGVLAVDTIILYEHLQDGLDEVANRLKLPGRIDMSAIHTKHKVRPNKAPYQSYYDDATKELIRIQFAREIALLNFVF
jgi:hypothetical protein